MQHLYFVRHGESQDNQDGIWSRPSTPLTYKGRGQAGNAGQAIKDQGLQFDLIVTSTLPRAQETARIIAHYIGYSEDKILIDKLFVERGWGEATGTSGNDFFASGKTRAHLDAVPGAELLADLQARAAQGLELLKGRTEANILLVGHGTFGRALSRVLKGQPYTDEYLPEIVRFANAEVTKLL